MFGIACSECASMNSYQVTTGAFFECHQCHHEITVEDLDIDPSEIWTVDANGILGFVIDPIVSLREMSDAIDEYMGEDHDSMGELEALRNFRDAALRLQGALEVGVPYPVAKM